MKRHMTALIVTLAAATAMARTYTPATLPLSTTLDTEVVTNFPCAFGNAAINGLSVQMAFFGSATNAVELAFGRDADGDGALGACEAEMAIGWDCGWWVLRGRDEAFSCACGDGDVEAEVGMEFRIGVLRGRPKSWTATIGGESANFGIPQEGEGDDAHMPVPCWLFNPEWNVARVSVRGIGGASERLRFETDVNALTIRIR